VAEVVRIVPRCADMVAEPIATAVVDTCNRCGHDVFVDISQSSPYQEFGLESQVCTVCGLDDPELRADVVKIIITAATTLAERRDIMSGKHEKPNSEDKGKGNGGGRHEKK